MPRRTKITIGGVTANFDDSGRLTNVNEYRNGVYLQGLFKSEVEVSKRSKLMVGDLEFTLLQKLLNGLIYRLEKAIDRIVAMRQVPSEMPASLNLKVVERSMILQAMRATDGVQKDAARLLGISPRTLTYKLTLMERDGIDLPVHWRRFKNKRKLNG